MFTLGAPVVLEVPELVSPSRPCGGAARRSLAAPAVSRSQSCQKKQPQRTKLAVSCCVSVSPGLGRQAQAWDGQEERAIWGSVQEPVLAYCEDATLVAAPSEPRTDRDAILRGFSDSDEVPEIDRLERIGIALKKPSVEGTLPSSTAASTPNRTAATAGDASPTWGPTSPLPPRLTAAQAIRRAKAKTLGASPASRTLLADVRKRRQFERMAQSAERDLAGAAEQAPPQARQWPFWRKKRDPDGLSSRQLTRRIAELKRRRQLGKVFDLLEEAKAKGRPPNTAVMNAALAACVHCGDVERALDLFDEMSLDPFCTPDSITYGCLLKGLGKARRLDDAFELLEEMEAGTAPGRPELTEVHLNTLVNVCADAGDARRARGVLQRFRAFGRGLGPSALTYNLLIKGYARSDNPLEALRVVDEMQLQGMPLERVSYNSLLLACIRGGDLEHALDLLQEMKAEAWKQSDASLWPDIVSYTTLLKGLAEDGDLEGILGLVREIKRGPSAGPDGARAEFVAQVMSSCKLDRVAYTAVIDACLAVGSTSDALEFLSEMEELARSDPSMRPRAHVFLALLRSLAAAGAFAEAQQLKGRLCRDAGGRVWPDDLWQADELVLEAAVKSGKIDEAEEIFRGMVQRLQRSSSSRGFSERGMEAVVRLTFSSQLPTAQLQPVPLKDGLALKTPVEAAMRRRSETLIVRPGCARGDAEAVLEQGQPFVPVLDDADECVGVLWEEDVREWDDLAEAETGLLKASALAAPACVSRFAPVGDAAAAMITKGAKFLVIVQGDLRHGAGLIKASATAYGERRAIGFVLEDMLF